MSPAPKSLYPKKERKTPVIPPMIPLFLVVLVIFIVAIIMAIKCTSPYNMVWA